MNNRNLFTHLYKHDCFTPITNLTVREARKENLLSCACEEFFEFMRKVGLCLSSLSIGKLKMGI